MIAHTVTVTLSKVSAKGGATRRRSPAEEAQQQAEGQCCLGSRDVECFCKNILYIVFMKPPKILYIVFTKPPSYIVFTKPPLYIVQRYFQVFGICFLLKRHMDYI